MKILTLTANLGSFDTVVDPVQQSLKEYEVWNHVCFTDSNFPPITGLTSRFQYRIAKMMPLQLLDPSLVDSEIIIWYDGSMSMQRNDSIRWFLEQLGDADCAFFEHPWRSSVAEEVLHIENKLQSRNNYITSRYKNGLHKEMLELMQKDHYRDHWLFASTTFIYRNTSTMRRMMRDWFLYQARYFTCDQVHLPYVMHKNNINVNVINEHVFKNKYISLVSRHK